MSLEFARLVWRRYLADVIDVRAILALEKRVASTKLASPIVCAAMAAVVVPVARSPSRPAMPSDEGVSTMKDFVEYEAEKQVGVKRPFFDLQDSCHAKRRKVLESVSKVVGLAVKVMDDAIVTSSIGVGSIVVSRTDNSMGQLVTTRAAVLTLTAKWLNLGDAPKKTKREQGDLVRKICTETKTAEDHIIANRDIALFATMAF